MSESNFHIDLASHFVFFPKLQILLSYFKQSLWTPQWLHTWAAGSSYKCSNWRHSDLHGWTWWARGMGQRDSRHKLLDGWGDAELHRGDVLIALMCPPTHGEQRRSQRAPESQMFGTLNSAECPGMPLIFHQSYLQGFINADTYLRRTYC